MRRRTGGLRLDSRIDTLYSCGTGAEIIAMPGGFATLLASGGTFAMFMFRLFPSLESRVDRLEGKVDDLARDVSDLRGEFRGRFAAQPAE